MTNPGPRLRLITRVGCHLCEVVEDNLVSLGVRVELLDVDQDEDLQRRYTDSVPVLLSGNLELARGSISMEGLQGALRQAGIVLEGVSRA